MYYWNKRNFEGLLQVAIALEEEPQFAYLAQYCRLRESGLRSKAFETLTAFIELTKTWETAFSRNACQRILELNAVMPEAHQFWSQPLSTLFVHPMLNAWLAEDPTSQIAMRWLGLLRGDIDLLQKSLTIFPEDVPVRRRVINWFLHDVDYATHHLVESRLLAGFEETKQALSNACKVLNVAPDHEPFKNENAEIKDYQQLLDDWESYCKSPNGTFPEWCANHGHSHKWPRMFYYNK